MPRIIFKCPYFKGGGSSAPHLQNLVKYMGSRDGVDKIDVSHKELPATVKQKKLIKQILKEFPSSKNLFEYTDYCSKPTIENASEFISQSLEQNLDQVSKRENYVEYIGQRPGVEMDGLHGLFTDEGNPVVLEQAAKEVANHPGNVWTPIISLRREDAARLGYDNGDAWRSLLRGYAGDLADHMKIPREDFRWYAAFHNQSHHPHIHMVCYSTNPKKGFLTRTGIEQIKSGLAKRIFRQDLLQIYSEQTTYRDLLNTQTDTKMRELCEKLRTGLTENIKIGQMIMQLSERLSNTKGKKVYGYLKPDVKKLVNQIIDELAKEDSIVALYDLWWQKRLDVLHTYSDKDPIKPLLSQQKEFKRLKNIVIEQAVKIETMKFEDEAAIEDDYPDYYLPDIDTTAFPGIIFNVNSDVLSEPEIKDHSDVQQGLYSIKWSKKFKSARGALYNDPPQFDLALSLFEQEAAKGNVLAMYELGRMAADGLGIEINEQQAHNWYEKSFQGFLFLAQSDDKKLIPYIQYRIGKMYASGLGTEQNYKEAAQWFQLAADAGYKYAQYSLAGLYTRGQGVDANNEKAFQLYTLSHNQTFAYASYELAKMYQNGVGTIANKEIANQCFKTAFDGFLLMAHENKDDKLQYRLGQMLLTGTGTKKNVAMAKEYLKKSAKCGNSYAQYQLAILVLNDSPSDDTETQNAIGLLIKAAKSGNSYAQYALGKLYRDGKYVQQDEREAVRMFIQSAEQENEYAQYTLGKLYLNAKSLPRDVEQAIRWLKLSADQGNQFAQYTLGKLYLMGEQVSKDVNLALSYLQSSADQGNQFAQYTLGKLYLMGKYLPRDKEQAVYWLTLSAEQGNKYAQFFLDNLDNIHDPSLLLCTAQLLHSVSKLFEDQFHKLNETGQIDRKRRKILKQKKLAQGHAQDEQTILDY